MAAGAMWRCRTASAPWAGRDGHTTVVDAAGAIYVIGGQGFNGILFNDVWVSTDGGTQPDSIRAWSGVLVGYSRGYYRGRYSRGSLGIPKGVRTWPTHPRAHFRPSPVSLSLRRRACNCSRRCYHMYGVHVSRQELCACWFVRSRAPACLLMRVCARLAVFVARPAPRVAAAARGCSSVPLAWLARVGRRGELDVPHGQRAVGWPIWAHVRGRRRRRHLRPRRRHYHLLRGRVGEHRRRYTTGLSRWGVVRGVIKGVLSGVHRGGGTRGVV